MNRYLQEQERAAYMAGNYALADAFDRLEQMETAAYSLLHSLPSLVDDDIATNAITNLREVLE